MQNLLGYSALLNLDSLCSHSIKIAFIELVNLDQQEDLKLIVDDQGANMYLKYQNQNSHQTLREAIEEYHEYLTHIGRQILTDSPEDTDPIWLYHDATHAIFGQDTTIEGEAALDFWVFFGTTFSWKLLKKYQQLPEIKDLSRALVSELGLTFIPKLYWRNKGVIWTVIRHTRRMTKKWPFELPSTLLDRRLDDLREEYGITVLTSEQKVPSRLTEFDYSIVSEIS